LKKQNNRIQAIISEIDEVLNQPSTESYPKIIEETLRKSQKILQETLECLTQDLDKRANLQLLSVDPYLASEDTIDLQIKQYPQKIEEFLAPINQYLQEDFTILKQQREALQEEIRQLEKQRRENYSLAQQYAKQEQIISEFSQALLGPVQETLVEHLSQLAAQHSSAARTGFSSNQDISPQTINNLETSEVMKISEEKLEEVDNLENSFVDDSNSDDSQEKKLTEENCVEDNIAAENIEMKKLSPEIDELNETVDRVVLPYPGYEFMERLDSKSKTTETKKKNIQLDKSNNQESSIDYQSSINEKQDLEILESDRQENESSAQLEPPSFEENSRESKNYHDRIVSVEDKVSITPELKLDASENRENLDSTEILESLSNLFGELEVDRGATKQLITTTKNQQNLTYLTADKLEEEEYIHAPVTQKLLPVEETDRKPDELLLDSQTIQHLRSDLESLEEIDVDELMDDPGQTQLQFGEDKDIDSTENTADSVDNSLVIASEEEVTNLENLFENDVDDVSEKAIASKEENISSSAKNTDNEITIEDILDSLTPTTNEEELIETDEGKFLALETLLEDSSNSEKKI